MTTIGERVQLKLKERGMSAKAASEAAGQSRNYVSKLIKGDFEASVEVLETLAKVLGVSVEWLRFGIDKTGEICPSRAAAIALMRGRGVPEGVIEALKTFTFADGDPGLPRWRELAKELLKEDAAYAGLLSQGREDEDVFGGGKTP